MAFSLPHATSHLLLKWPSILSLLFRVERRSSSSSSSCQHSSLQKMLSIFTQTAQTSASEPQQSPADEGRKSGAPLGYSSCTIA